MISVRIFSALSCRNLCRGKAETVHSLPEGLLSEQRPSRFLLALSVRHVHEGRRIEEHRRLRTGLRLRHVLAYGSRALSRVSQKQLHGRAADRWLQGLPDLPSWNVHLPASRARSRSLPRQMFTGHVFGYGTRSLRSVSQELLPAPARRDHVRRVSHEHVYRRAWFGRSRGVQACPVHRQRVSARRSLRADGTRRALLLSGRLLWETLRDRHRRVRVSAVLQWCYLYRSAARLQVSMRQQLFRRQLPGGEVGLCERHMSGKSHVQGRTWI